MNRQTRLILLLAGLALVGVVALGAMAQRYSRIMLNREARPDVASDNADRQVEAFLQVRASLHAKLDPGAFREIPPDARALAFAAQRDRALGAARMDPADYRTVREHYRRWLRAPEKSDAAWRAVLERHRSALESYPLGEWEQIDR